MTFIYKHRKSMSVLEFSLLVTVPLLTPSHLPGRVPVCTGREERGVTASDELQAFIGTWRGELHGQPMVTLILKNVGNEIAGSIIFYLYEDGKLVDQDEVQLLTPKFQADTLNFSVHEARMCASCHAARREKGLVRDPRYGELLPFAMKLVGDRQAQLRTLGVPASEFSLLRLTRQR